MQDIFIKLSKTAGFALHWLHPKSKAPIGKNWSSVPVASLEDLQRSYHEDNNLGVRLGEPSALSDGTYLHVLDIDIRLPELVEEAWEAFDILFPNIDRESFPSVISGSGGESRHVYFTTDKPFFSKKLKVSEGKHRSDDGKWHYDWEIELFGTGKQVAMPPSIHPDTGERYLWEREFPFDLLEMGLGPAISSAELEKIATAESETYEFESRDPLTYKDGQLEAELFEIDETRLSDYHDWVTLGQALHHQFGGHKAGFDIWVEHSKRDKKNYNEQAIREMPGKWRGFGRNRRAPVTMATVRQWIIDARRDATIAQFDDVDAFDEVLGGDQTDEIDDILGTNSQKSDIFDDILGGDQEVDEIDALLSEKLSDARPEMEWKSLLDFNEDGAIRPNLHNISLIVQNDKRLTGIPQINEFTQETVQRREPGRKAARKRAAKPTGQLDGRIWTVEDPLNGVLWSDDRDFDVRRVVEAPKTQGGYGIKLSDRDLKAAVCIAANNNPFHPVREYLDGLKWDGVKRAERLFVDYLGADDIQYSHDVARLMLIGAITRIFEPGHKFDFAVIIEGIQGKRKSTFIRILGHSWFAELDGDFHDQKQMIELMQGAWIMEIPELTGFTRADVRALKAFISRQKDRARLAYARRAGEFPRQCIFIGSTNDREYLKDDTGGRRFWPMPCTVGEIDTERFAKNVDQVWAEAVLMYHEMRKAHPHGTLALYLQHEDSRITAARLQESRRVEGADDAMIGQISNWLETPISDGGFDDIDADTAEPKFRNETCLIEIWCDCLAGDRKSYNQSVAQMIGRALQRMPAWVHDGGYYTNEKYGRQRVYFRGGSKAELDRRISTKPHEIKR